MQVNFATALSFVQFPEFTTKMTFKCVSSLCCHSNIQPVWSNSAIYHIVIHSCEVTVITSSFSKLTHSILPVFSPDFPCTLTVVLVRVSKKRVKEKKSKVHREMNFHSVLLEGWFMICINCKSFTIYLGDLHGDEEMYIFFLTEWVTWRAASVWKYAVSEPKTKTAAKLRVHLHQEKVVKWSYDHLFQSNHETNLPHIFESTDRMCSPYSIDVLCAVRPGMWFFV